MMLSKTSLSTLIVVTLTACAGARQGAGAGAGPAVGAAPPVVHSPEYADGVAAFEQGDYARARTDFEAAFKANAVDGEALWRLGQTCEKLGDIQSAATAYRAELALTPGAELASAALANLYVAQGDTEAALGTATAGLASHPGSAALHGAMGAALATQGDKDAAIAQFEQAIALAPADPALYYAAAVWLNRWHVRGAAPHLDAALPLVHDNYPLLVSIGHEYRLAGEFDACIKTFDAAIKTRDGGEVRTERALCKLGLKDEAGALANLQSAVETEPSYAQGHFFLAGRLASKKHYKDAAGEYASYLQLAPNGSLADQANERLKAAQDAAASASDRPDKTVAAVTTKTAKKAR